MDQFWGVWGVSRNVGKARVENAREHTDDGWEPWRKDTCPDIQNIKVRRVDQVARATLGKMLGLIENAIRKFLEPQSFWDQNRGQIRQTRYIRTYIHTYIQNRTEHYLTFTIYHLHYITLHTYIIISYIYIWIIYAHYTRWQSLTHRCRATLQGWKRSPPNWRRLWMAARPGPISLVNGVITTWKTHEKHMTTPMI